MLSLTPQGLNYGDSTTVGIGTITVPPLGQYQTYNTVVNINLPAVEPLSIANYTNFGLTMTQDSNYVTNDLYPDSPTQGVSYDQTSMTITTSTTSTATTGSLPDLAASSVMGPTGTVRWARRSGQHRRPEPRPGGRRPVQVFFVLTGQTGSITDAIYLGQTTISGLAAGPRNGQPDPDAADAPALGHVAQQRRLRPHRRDRGPGQRHQRDAQEQRRIDLGPVHRPPARDRHHRADPEGGRALPSVETVAQQAQAAAKAAARKHAAKVHATRVVQPAKELHRHAAPKPTVSSTRGKAPPRRSRSYRIRSRA